MENHEKLETIVFGGGCFWCTEAIFKHLKGVESVESGYAGGQTANPSYAEVSKGETGHAEVVKIDHDPTVIELEKLLTIFFATHDPTTLNRQGADTGPQYRSIILYSTDDQQKISQQFIEQLNSASELGDPVVTEVKKLDKFYPAEPEHQSFYARNKNSGYCQVVINPKLTKLKEKFAELLV